MSKELKNKGDRTAEEITLDRKKPLEQYLMERDIVDFDVLTVQHINGQVPTGQASVTLNEEVLAKVANTWENGKDAITAVISARIKPLIIEAGLTAEPQEVMVIRQCIKELTSVLDDFEALHLENVRRSQNKPKQEEPVGDTPD